MEINWENKTNVLEIYHALNCADFFIIGVTTKTNVLAYIIKKIPADFCKCDRTSKNSKGISHKKIVFRPNQKQINELSQKYKPLFTMLINDFNNEKLINNINNNGEMFEKIVVEKFNKQWRRTNEPFDIEPDLTVNNVNFQIKFMRAEICNEQNLQNAYDRYMKKISP